MKKKNLSLFVLLGALLLAFCATSVSIAAPDSVKDDKMSKPGADFNAPTHKQDPVVQTTSGKTPPQAGESVEDNKMSRDGADFKKETSKSDPVVQTTGGKVPTASGESVKDDGMNKHEAK